LTARAPAPLIRLTCLSLGSETGVDSNMMKHADRPILLVEDSSTRNARRTHDCLFSGGLDTTSGGRLLIGKVRSPVCRMALICALLIYGSGSLLVRTKRSAHPFELDRAGMLAAASVAKQP